MFKLITSTLLFSLTLATGNESIVPIKFRLRRDKEILQLCLGDSLKIDGLDDNRLLNIFDDSYKVKCKFDRNNKRGKDILELFALEDGINSDLILNPSEDGDDKIIITLRQEHDYKRHTHDIRKPKIQSENFIDYNPK